MGFSGGGCFLRGEFFAESDVFGSEISRGNLTRGKFARVTV